MSYALALGLTLLVEVPLYGAVLTRMGRVVPLSAVGTAFLVNLVTHPLLWWFLSTRGRAVGEDGAVGVEAIPYPLAFAAGELAVWLVEALLLRWVLRLRGPLPYAIALTANAASVLAGLLLFG